MLLDLKTIRGTRDRLERTWPAAAFLPASEEYEVTGTVTLAADVYKDHDRVRLAGRVRAGLSLSCGRCLEPYTVAVDAPFDLRFLPQVDNSGEGEVEIQEDDLSTAYYRDDAIDLRQLLREQFYLALPMKPLCDPACLGLCPSCGINLNRETCACDPRWEDPRLAGLRALLPKGSSSD